jgi:hypothetical protein
MQGIHSLDELKAESEKILRRVNKGGKRTGSLNKQCGD